MQTILAGQPLYSSGGPPSPQMTYVSANPISKLAQWVLTLQGYDFAI